MTKFRHCALLAALISLSCGPSFGPSSAEAGGQGETGGGGPGEPGTPDGGMGSSLSAGAPASGGPTSGGPTSGGPTSSGPTADATSASGPDTSSETDGPDDTTFLVPPDLSNHCVTGSACGVWAQDCLEGEKCVASEDCVGENRWNTSRCVPVHRNPATVGETCIVLAGAFGGFDNCEFGAMCFGVDPQTDEGTCVAQCTGSPGNASCGPGFSCATSNGRLNLCFPYCDPLLGDCDDGQACKPYAETFLCIRHALAPALPGDPCNFIGDCNPGSVCVDAQTAGCDARACCTAYCDLTAADPAAPCLGDQICTPWRLDAPPDLNAVGFCTVGP